MATEICAIAAGFPSVFIPYAWMNVTKERVRSVFDQMGYGKIGTIQEVVKKEGKKTFKQYRVHFNTWALSNYDAMCARGHLLMGGFIKIPYCPEGWYWKVWMDTKPPEERVAAGTLVPVVQSLVTC